MDMDTYFILNEKWVTEKILGRGAYGIVSKIYPLFHSSSSSLPSIKAIKSSLKTDSLLEKEILLMFKYHPNIIRYYGSQINHVTTNLGLKIPSYHIFLEYASDGYLTNEIKKTRGKGFSEERVIVYLKGILLGLKEIHKAGIHCDIKPSNILIADGVPKIADFGLALKSEDFGLERGTPEFMAPEIIAYGIYTACAYIWSLGCTVLMMLNGKNVWRVPFKRDMMKLIGDYDVHPKIPDELSILNNVVQIKKNVFG